MLASVALDAKIISETFYSSLVMLAVLTSLMAGSWLGRIVRNGESRETSERRPSAGRARTRLRRCSTGRGPDRGPRLDAKADEHDATGRRHRPGSTICRLEEGLGPAPVRASQIFHHDLLQNHVLGHGDGAVGGRDGSTTKVGTRAHAGRGGVASRPVPVGRAGSSPLDPHCPVAISPIVC